MAIPEIKFQRLDCLAPNSFTGMGGAGRARTDDYRIMSSGL